MNKLGCLLNHEWSVQHVSCKCGETKQTIKHQAPYFSPKEPPPPPAPEASWEETPSEVQHLHDADFKPFLKKKKHALVMFYAPCK